MRLISGVTMNTPILTVGRPPSTPRPPPDPEERRVLLFSGMRVFGFFTLLADVYLLDLLFFGL